MGLFIGASILTILELFDYAYEVRRRRSPSECSFGLPARRLRFVSLAPPPAAVSSDHDLPPPTHTPEGLCFRALISLLAVMV